MSGALEQGAGEPARAGGGARAGDLDRDRDLDPDRDRERDARARAHLAALGVEARRAAGMFFTPAALARALVARAGLAPGARVLDPACGHGRLLAAARGAGAEVYGLDADAVLASLAAEAVGERGLVVRGDALALHDVGWPAGFPERFDAVLANPPFVSAARLDAATRRALAARLPELRGRWDLAAAFVLLALARVRPGGRLVLILPESFATESYAAAVRARLAAEAWLRAIVRPRRRPRTREGDAARVRAPSPDRATFDAIVRWVALVAEARGEAHERAREAAEPRGEALAPPEELTWDGEALRPAEPVVTGAASRAPDRPTRLEGSAPRDDSTPLDSASPRVARGGGRLHAPAAALEVPGAVPLGALALVARGLELGSNERLPGARFVKDDLVSPTPDHTHPLPYVEGSDLGPHRLTRVRWLEWHTERVPARIRRARAPGLLALPKLLCAITSGGVWWDRRGRFACNHSVNLVVRWCDVPRALDATSLVRTTSARAWREGPRGGGIPALREAAAGVELGWLAAVVGWPRLRSAFEAAHSRDRADLYPDDLAALPVLVPSPRVQRRAGQLVAAAMRLPHATRYRARVAAVLDRLLRGVYGDRVPG